MTLLEKERSALMSVVQEHDGCSDALAAAVQAVTAQKDELLSRHEEMCARHDHVPRGAPFVRVSAHLTLPFSWHVWPAVRVGFTATGRSSGHVAEAA